MGEERVPMKLVLCLSLAIFAASAMADVTELPESAATESVEPADMEFIEASFEDAKQTVTGLMQAGKKDAACKALADASKKEVTDSVAASQKVVKAMPNGSQCNSEGKDLIKTAEDNVKTAKKAVSDAQNKINAAKAVKINFGDFVVSSLDGKKCANFYNSLVYTNAKKKIKDAETHYTKKVAEKNAADKAVVTAKAEAERLVRHCKCASKRAIDKAIADFNSKSAAMNKATWTKAYHMECVLAGKTAAGCSVPTVPTVKPVPFASGVSTACSGKSNYLGCFVDNGSRDLKHGPKRYGYNPTNCMSACKDYKFIALQDGGWCNCDNTYSTPSSTYSKQPDNQCNKGGTGQGGGWRNAVYSNVDHIKDELCVSLGKMSSNNAGHINTANPGKCKNAKIVGGGMSQTRGWGKLGAIERFYPKSTSTYQCDTGFGGGHLTCFGIYASNNGRGLTCQTRSKRMNKKSGSGTAVLDAGYVMTGGGIVTHYTKWDNHAQFERSQPHGNNGWLSDMGFGWGDYTSYVTGCKGLKCKTVESKRGDGTEAKCPAGYKVTGCGMRNHYGKMDKKSAFEQMQPADSLDRCVCNMGIGAGDDSCFARCCKMA